MSGTPLLKAAEFRKQLKLKILHSETCSAWFHNLPQFQNKELETILEMYCPGQDIKYDHKHDSDPDTNYDSVDLKYSAIEEIAKECIIAHLFLVLKQTEKVHAAIGKALKLIQDCLEKSYFSQELALGFNYVTRGLHISFAMEQTNKDEDDVLILERYLGDLNRFQNFSDKNIVGVLALKQFFIGKISHASHEMQLEVIYKMIKLDPQNCEWYYYLYITIRFQRNSIQEAGMPWEDEIQAIRRALNSQRGAQLDPRILLSHIVCFSEIHRDRLRRGQRDSFEYGGVLFTSTQSVVNFIKVKAEQILSMNPISVRVNLEIAKMLSLVHPRSPSQLQFSKACIRRALLFHPNSSKANHRMGVFYISCHDLSSALPYIQKAYEVNKRNMRALEELIMLYMNDTKSNSAALASVFEDALSFGYYLKYSSTISRLIFLKAIYVLLAGLGTKEDIVDLLIESLTASERVLQDLKKINISIVRYNWYEHVPGEIQTKIKEILFNAAIRCTYLLQKVKLEKLHEAARDMFLVVPAQSRKIQTQDRTCGFYSTNALNSVQRTSWSAVGTETGTGTGTNNASLDRNWRVTDRNWRRTGDVSEGSIVTAAERKAPSLTYDISQNMHKSGNTVVAKFQSRSDSDNNWRSGSGRDNKQEVMDPFDVLGVPEGTSPIGVDEAYASLTKLNHSKQSNHSEGDLFREQENMMRINKAWEMLQA